MIVIIVLLVAALSVVITYIFWGDETLRRDDNLSQPTPLEGGKEFIGGNGCGDAIVYAVTDDDDALVSARWDGAASRGFEHGDFEDELTLPHPEVNAGLIEGSDVSTGICTDIGNPPAVVDERWSAVEGTVHIQVEVHEEGEHPDARATVLLEEVVFETEEHDQTWRFDTIEIHKATIGVYAG